MQPAQNSQQQRVRGKPFPKGTSGNPGGRPRGTGRVSELARQHTSEAIETILELMRSGQNDSVRLKAAETLLARGWGREPVIVEESRSDEERLARIAESHAVLSQLSMDELKTMRRIKRKLEAHAEAYLAENVSA